MLKTLEKDREDRQQTMQAFADDLQDFERRPATIRVAPKRRRPTAGVSLFHRWLGLSIFIAAAVFVAVWYMRTMPWGNHAEAPTLSAAPLTTFEGFKDFGSFSPDGNRTAFSWNGGRGGSGGHPQRNIYIKAVGHDEPVQITFAPEDDRMPVWSPDGKYIAFCRVHPVASGPNQYDIYVIPVEGGKARKIAEGGLRGDSSGILVKSLATGERRRLTGSHPHFDTLPVFSPDGQWIVFTRDFGFSLWEVFVIPTSGGTAKQLTFDREPTYGAAWTSDSREIVFSSNRGVGGENLWRIPATGGVPRRVTATLQGAFYPAISRQGNRLVYTESFKDTNIYAYDGPGFGSALNRAGPGRFGAPKGLILSSRRDDSLNISPDGERIAFVSKRTGNEEIWVCNRNGGQLMQLTAFRVPGTGTPRWRWNATPFDRWASRELHAIVVG